MLRCEFRIMDIFVLKQNNLLNQFQFFLFIYYLKKNGKLSEIVLLIQVRKKAKIGNQYNQVPHLTQDTI